MGTSQIISLSTPAARAEFARGVLRDLHLLERMLEEGRLGEGPLHIGAEQELLLVDRSLSPAFVGEQLLRRLRSDPRFVAELGRCNLEVNLTPRVLGAGCFAQLEQELHGLCSRARSVAAELDVGLMLAGLMPTFDVFHGSEEAMTPSERFVALGRVAAGSRGGNFQFNICGLDTLNVTHGNILLEAATSSFQVHLQVNPEDFVSTFNAALLTAAPLLAACANSALFAGHRLFHETRVPLLEVSSDARTPGQRARPGHSRTGLGHGWLRHSVLEAYRTDLRRYPAVLAPSVGPDGSDKGALDASAPPPSLRHLAAFTSTVWRWMRPCYGVTDGKPHLRIENRVLPAGPTPEDEIANAAFWVGLMLGYRTEVSSLPGSLSFLDAEANFHAAARDGLEARLTWLGGEKVTARELLQRELFPAARRGLQRHGLQGEAHLQRVEERVARGRTGAAWMLEAYARTPEELPRRSRIWHVASRMQAQGWSGVPVHRWQVEGPPADFVPSVAAALRPEVPAVWQDTPMELAAEVMAWEGMSHLVVEDVLGHFLGMLSSATVEVWRKEGAPARLVSEVISPREAVVLTPDMTAEDALERLHQGGSTCGAVLKGAFIVGIVHEADLGALLRSARPETGEGLGVGAQSDVA